MRIIDGVERVGCGNNDIRAKFKNMTYLINL